jgi:PleD family two-component response regulator
MNAYWHILSDNIMERYEFTSYLEAQEVHFSFIPPTLDEFASRAVPSFFIVNMHAESFDAFTFFQTIKEDSRDLNIHIIAYTDLKHDHEGIHKAKTHGVRYVCTKDQVKELLSYIQRIVNG